MAKKAANKDSEFRVSLRGLGLDEAAEAALESSLRRVVLEHLAGIDNKGDLSLGSADRLKQIFGPGIRGFVAEKALAAGGGNRVLYGVVIREAIRRGNIEEMKQLGQQVSATLGQRSDIEAALAELNKAIQNLER